MHCSVAGGVTCVTLAIKRTICPYVTQLQTWSLILDLIEMCTGRNFTILCNWHAFCVQSVWKWCHCRISTVVYSMRVLCYDFYWICRVVHLLEVLNKIRKSLCQRFFYMYCICRGSTKYNLKNLCKYSIENVWNWNSSAVGHERKLQLSCIFLSNTSITYFQDYNIETYHDGT